MLDMIMMTTTDTNIPPASTGYRVSLLNTLSLLHSSLGASCVAWNAAVAAAAVVDDFGRERICFLTTFLASGSDKPRNVFLALMIN